MVYSACLVRHDVSSRCGVCVLSCVHLPCQINGEFDTGSYPDLSKASPNDVSGVLKFFLRSLPEPLLTENLFQPFMDVLGTPTVLIVGTHLALQPSRLLKSACWP